MGLRSCFGLVFGRYSARSLSKMWSRNLVQQSWLSWVHSEGEIDGSTVEMISAIEIQMGQPLGELQPWLVEPKRLMVSLCKIDGI